MNTEPAFPSLNLVKVDEERSARYKGERELTPFVDRRPDLYWLAFFYDCAKAARLDWKAGFAVCPQADVDRVRASLHEVTDQTNQLCAEFLAVAAPRDEALTLIERELASAAAVDGEMYRVVISHLRS
jgi:hypothetical protein